MSWLGEDGWTPVTLGISQTYGHILVTDEAEDELHNEWKDKPCTCPEYGGLCDSCTARKMLGVKEGDTMSKGVSEVDKKNLKREEEVERNRARLERARDIAEGIADAVATSRDGDPKDTAETVRSMIETMTEYLDRIEGFTTEYARIPHEEEEKSS